ncbi:MAG TPA: cytochrome c [Blastocatellia bacterium]|nr:cytochrome c [Blastocatellia bacterium]
MKRIAKLAFIASLLFVAAPLWLRGGSNIHFKVEAEPSWARRYNAKCTLCHTTYPRLNRTGYEFKRLGYRLPREVEATGKGAPTTQTATAQAAHKPYVIEPTGYKPKPTTPESDRGKALFERLDCASCHSIASNGGRIGPPLDGVGGRRDEQFLTAHITNPEEHAKKFPELHGNQPSRMPHPQASTEEVRLLVAYLVTLTEPAGGFQVNPHVHADLPGSPPGDFVPAAMTDSARAGQKLYLDLGCASCHAIGGAGGQFGPALDGIGARRTRIWIEAHVTNPQLHTQQFPSEHAGESSMPVTNATPAQIAQIADYLLTLPGQETAQTGKWRLPDYFGISYAPGIEWENSNGETTRTFEKRELVIYAAGPIGRNFSFFVQPLPASEEKGFGGKFEMAQGLLNLGGSRNYFQARFGQLFNLRNTGFAGTDRGLTESLPFIFQGVNGFNPSGLGRGVSLEYTLRRTTTVKVFGDYHEAAELEAEEGEPVPEPRRSRTGGFVFEHVIGNKGLSGVQFEFATGRTPFLLDDVRQRSLRFQRYSFFVNKTFVDAKNFERVNVIFGASLLRDDRFFGLDTDQRSRGWGYFFEVDTIPIVDHLSLFARYDQLRPTTLIPDNTGRGGTFGVIYDFVKYARMSFEYQRLDNGIAVNRYRLGWQFNF